MGYMHIDNLYKVPDMLMFKEVYAMEKIHGTSANVSYRVLEAQEGNFELKFHSGGVKHESFCKLFDFGGLATKFHELGHDQVTVYGEAYGGKCQGMSEVYGKDLKFVAFEVKIGDTFLTVPDAHDVATKLGLEFVFYKKIPCTEYYVNWERDQASIQALRNTGLHGLKGEGIVLRPLIELTRSNGDRMIAKHKRDDFKETRKTRKLGTDPEVLREAEAIALEWVTDMRLQHILQRFPEPHDMKITGQVIKAMIADVERESAGEVVWSKPAQKAVGTAAAKMYKKLVMQFPKGAENG